MEEDLEKLLEKGDMLLYLIRLTKLLNVSHQALQKLSLTFRLLRLLELLEQLRVCDTGYLASG